MIKTKDKILKKVKDLIMIEEIVNEDLEKTAKSVKSSDEAVEAVNNVTYYGLHTNMAKYLKNSK